LVGLLGGLLVSLYDCVDACSLGCWVGGFCLFLFCGWMVGFVFGYLLNVFMFAGVFICFDTDLICYLISVFVSCCLLC
jgi:hypothetical protein